MFNDSSRDNHVTQSRKRKRDQSEGFVFLFRVSSVQIIFKRFLTIFECVPVHRERHLFSSFHDYNSYVRKFKI